MSVEPNGEQWAYHQLEIRNQSLFAKIEPEINCLPLTVYIKEFKRPTKTRYFEKWELPNNVTCRWNDDDEDWLADNGITSDTQMNFCDERIRELFTCSGEPYSVFLSDELGMNGTFYLGE